MEMGSSRVLNEQRPLRLSSGRKRVEPMDGGVGYYWALSGANWQRGGRYPYPGESERMSWWS